MRLTPEELKAFSRQDLSVFIERCFHERNPQTEYLHNWHIEVIAAELEKCLRGKTKRLIINLPPRSLKSVCASVAFPAFILGQNPAAKIICASYGQKLAETLAGDHRAIMVSDWYRDLFPGTRLARRKQAINDFRTTQQGFRLSTSVGGPMTGQGGDFIIIDDPHKSDEALSDSRRDAVNGWFDNSVICRLNNQHTGCIILIMQRLHEDDLVGHVQKLGDWRLVKFPAIAEEDEYFEIQNFFGKRRLERKKGEPLHPAQAPLEALIRLRQSMGEYNFAGQYQQTPAPAEGGRIKRAWFKYYTPADRPEKFDRIVQSWDTANKDAEGNDFSVCTTWGLKGEKVYLLDVLRRRMDYPELKKSVRDQGEKYKADVILVEDKASGTPVIQELRRDRIDRVTGYASNLDKFSRLILSSSMIEQGSVYLPERAEWLDEYLHELTIFPKGRYDDQVDSTSQALDWVKNRLSAFEIPTWVRYQARENWIEEGRLEEVREMDAKYGAPPEKPKPERPSGPAVYTRYKKL
jgi:predicted phage terminase large subunit-like protein